MVNWLFAIPAVYTIDTFGRRNLLLTTFPLMSFFLFFGGFSFLVPNGADGEPSQAKLGCIATAIYMVSRIVETKFVDAILITDAVHGRVFSRRRSRAVYIQR